MSMSYIKVSPANLPGEQINFKVRNGIVLLESIKKVFPTATMLTYKINEEIFSVQEENGLIKIEDGIIEYNAYSPPDSNKNSKSKY